MVLVSKTPSVEECLYLNCAEISIDWLPNQILSVEVELKDTDQWTVGREWGEL